MPALTAKDKLSLEGVGIIVTLLMALGASIVWMENRYATQNDIRTLRCDVYMLHLIELKEEGDQEVKKRVERRWDQLCSGSRLREARS